jgi:hypothetical protein
MWSANVCGIRILGLAVSPRSVGCVGDARGEECGENTSLMDSPFTFEMPEVEG